MAKYLDDTGTAHLVDKVKDTFIAKGGTLTAPLTATNGSTGSFKLDKDNNGQIIAGTNDTIFGFRNNVSTRLTVGGTGYELNLRGSNLEDYSNATNNSNIVKSGKCRYIRIGRLVFFMFDDVIFKAGTIADGDNIFTGLPGTSSLAKMHPSITFSNGTQLRVEVATATIDNVSQGVIRTNGHSKTLSSDTRGFMSGFYLTGAL